jgi:hypothetical protein
LLRVTGNRIIKEGKNREEIIDKMNKFREIESCYKILDLAPGASEEEIKKAYRILVKVWHPDRFSQDPKLQKKAQEKLKEINLAYEKLNLYLKENAGKYQARKRANYGEPKSPPGKPPRGSGRKQEGASDRETHRRPHSGQPSGQQPSGGKAGVSHLPRVSPINLKRGLALALVVIGTLILLDQMGTGYGLRDGWPWLIIALGVGGFFKKGKGSAAWAVAVIIIGILFLFTRYYTIYIRIPYTIHIRVPGVFKTYFLPCFLILIGLFWLLRSLKKSAK